MASFPRIETNRRRCKDPEGTDARRYCHVSRYRTMDHVRAISRGIHSILPPQIG